MVTCPNCGTTSRIRANAPGRPVCRECKRRLPWIVDADESTFADEVAGPVPAIVDFWAGWCPPCRAIAPVLEEMAAARAGQLKIVKVDVDANPGLAQRFGAMSIPLLVFMRDGAERDRVVGAVPRPQLEMTLAPIMAG